SATRSRSVHEGDRAGVQVAPSPDPRALGEGEGQGRAMPCLLVLSRSTSAVLTPQRLEQRLDRPGLANERGLEVERIDDGTRAALAGNEHRQAEGGRNAGHDRTGERTQRSSRRRYARRGRGAVAV